MELASSSVRLVRAQRSSDGLRIAQSTEVEFPPDIYKEGQIFEPTAFGKTLKEAIRRDLAGGGNAVALSVGGQGVLVRRVGLPKMKPVELRHLMETQGDQWIPFLREGAAFHLEVIDPKASEHQQEVLIAAVPTRYHEYAATVLKLAGLKLAALDVDVSALYRAAVAGGVAPSQGTVALLDLNQEKPRLGLFQQGLLVAVRSLDNRQMRSMASTGLYDDLSVEVRRSLELMSTPLRDGSFLNCLAVIASGETEGLMQVLEREVRTGLGPRLAEDFRIALGPGAGVSTNMALAYGLALTQVEAPRPLDLMPRPTVRENRHRRTSVLLSVLLLAGLAGYGLFWNSTVPALEKQEAAKNRQLTKLQTELKKEPAIAAEERLASALQPVQAELEKYDPWSVAHPHLKEILPTGVMLRSVGGQLPKLSIQGTAPTPDLVAQLMNALDQSPYLKDPVLVSSGAGAGPVSFALTVELERRGGREQ